MEGECCSLIEVQAELCEMAGKDASARASESGAGVRGRPARRQILSPCLKSHLRRVALKGSEQSEPEQHLNVR